MVLCEEIQKEILTAINTRDQSVNSLHNIVNKIENIFTKRATTCKTKGRKIPKRKINTNKINKHKPWYNKGSKKRQLNKLCKSLSKSPNNTYTRGLYFFNEEKIQE